MSGTGNEGDWQKLFNNVFPKESNHVPIPQRQESNASQLLVFHTEFGVQNKKKVKWVLISCMLMKRGCHTLDNIREDSTDRLSSRSV